MSDATADAVCTIASLFVHPVKSCAGIPVREALVVETGFDLDRHWMVADRAGRMLTQRQEPRLALVQPRLRGDELVLRAPGMLALHVALDRVEAPARFSVWNDEGDAWDLGDLAAQWFSDFLGRKGEDALRLLRFDPDRPRIADSEWTGEHTAQASFADGFPLLVAGTASLAELNARLAARGEAPVGIERFRPNIAIAGLDDFAEDHVNEIEFATPEGPVRLKLVKPCVRCTIPSVDPATGVQGSEPGRTLAQFRADPRMQGGITFGMNAIVLEGFDRTLQVGQTGAVSFAFD